MPTHLLTRSPFIKGKIPTVSETPPHHRRVRQSEGGVQLSAGQVVPQGPFDAIPNGAYTLPQVLTCRGASTHTFRRTRHRSRERSGPDATLRRPQHTRKSSLAQLGPRSARIPLLGPCVFPPQIQATGESRVRA